MHMRRAAEAGDGDAMRKLGLCYQHGQNGITKDETTAMKWYELAHAAGCATGTAMIGLCYLEGSGVAQASMTGCAFLSEAAHAGSQAACYNLGCFFASGRYGFPTDLKMTRRWLSMVASAAVEDLPCVPRPDC